MADAAGGPIRLLPRLREVVAAHYPGTKIAISEYNYGRTGDISGGVAQADVLGIFGREEVFAAAFWPLANPYASDYGGSGAKAYAYAFGAFRMYLNYDGEGGRFGDTGLRTTTSDPATTSAYASLDAAGRVVIVAINKLGEQRVATFRIAAPTEMHGARVFTLTGASPMPQAIGTLTVRGNVLAYPMPPLSVSTIVLAP